MERSPDTSNAATTHLSPEAAPIVGDISGEPVIDLREVRAGDSAATPQDHVRSSGEAQIGQMVGSLQELWRQKVLEALDGSEAGAIDNSLMQQLQQLEAAGIDPEVLLGEVSGEMLAEYSGDPGGQTTSSPGRRARAQGHPHGVCRAQASTGAAKGAAGREGR